MATRVAASGGPGASGGAGPGGPGSGAAARALEGFHSLRAEQRALANKLSELEQELNEHKYYRMIHPDQFPTLNRLNVFFDVSFSFQNRHRHPESGQRGQEVFPNDRWCIV